MNQILQVQENKTKKKQPVDTKKVVLFFAVCIIIFGIIFIGEGVNALYQAQNNQKVSRKDTSNEGKMEVYPMPVITLNRVENHKIKIDVDSQVALSNLLYHWNNESAQTIDENGKTKVEEYIEIPVGQNTLYITVIDQNGKETKKTEMYFLEATKPVIELSVLGNDIKISVTSELDLNYVTYKWNNEEETKVEMTTYENKKQLEKSIEIPKGHNTLKIVAVDINENSTEKLQEIRGVTKAKTSTLVKGEYLTFTIEGEDNIQKIEYEWNGKAYFMDKNTFGETNHVYYRVKLEPGWNYLKITSTTIHGAQDTTFWKYEYKAQ